MDAPNGEVPDQWAPVNMRGDAGGGAQDIDTKDAANMGSECTPGERLCTPDNRGVRICDANGRFLNDTPCTEDEFCDLGECSPQECVPDSRGCVGDIIRVCDEWGSGFLVEQDEDCAASGAQCIDGVCIDAVEASRGQTCDTIECLSQRSPDLVCARYAADILSPTRDPFMSGANSCDPGELTTEAYDEALAVANFGRWLSGLREVIYDEGLNPRSQACAAMMSNQRALNHHPPENWACYTAEGHKQLERAISTLVISLRRSREL